MLEKSERSVLHILAHHFLWNGQFQDAEALFALLLQDTPDSLQVRVGFALAQIRNGAPEAALRSLAPVAESGGPIVQLVLGKAFVLLGDIENAQRVMRNFCAIDRIVPKPVLVDGEYT